MHKAVLENSIPQAVCVLLPEMLPEVPVCASGVLRQQAGLLLLQQLEDEARRSEVPIIFQLSIQLIYHPMAV
jgi:hypothetical protein